MGSKKGHNSQSVGTITLFNREPLSLLLPISVGIVLGVVILFMGSLPYKWIFSISVVAFFPLFVAFIGSVKRALEALLILSFGMIFDVNIGFTEKYSDLIWGTPITLTLFLLVCLYLHWALRLLYSKEKVNFFPIITVPMIVIIFWSGVSLFWSARQDYTIYNLWGMVEMFLLLFYTANFLKSKTDIHFVVTCIAIIIGINGLAAIVQYSTGSFLGLEVLGTANQDEMQDALTFADLGIFRVSGFLDNPNSFAWFMKVWLPILLLWAVGGPERIYRYFYIISFILGFFGLVLSFSRGAWVSFSFSIILVIILLFRNRQHAFFHKIVVRLLLMVLIVALLMIPFFPKIINRLTSDDYGSSYSRIPMAQVALNIIQQNPIKGVGLGNYRYVMHKYDNTPENISIEFPHPVHNVYLMLAAELGIGALSLFIFISIVVYSYGFRMLKLRNAAVALFILGLIGGLTGFYLHGMVEQGIIGSWKFRPLWFASGLILACSKVRDDT